MAWLNSISILNRINQKDKIIYLFFIDISKNLLGNKVHRNTIYITAIAMIYTGCPKKKGEVGSQLIKRPLMASNHKVEEKRPLLKFNFTY